MMKFFDPPVFDDEEKTLNARLIHTIIVTLMFTGCFALLISVILPETIFRWLILIGFMQVAGVAGVILNKRGYVKTAGYLLIFAIWATATAMALTSGGTRSNAMALYLVVVVVAGLIQSGRAGIITAALCSLTGLMLVYMEKQAWLPDSHITHTTFTMWVAYTAYLTIVIVLQYLASRTIRTALRNARREIRNRLKVDAALRESEERYRTVIESTEAGIILQDRTGKILSWNPAAERIFSIGADEAVKHTSISRDWKTYHENGEEMPGNDHPSMRTLKSGQPCRNVVMKIARSENDFSWLTVNTTPVFDDDNVKPKAVVITFLDITERKQAEEELLQSRRLMNDVIDFLPDATLAIDHEKKIIVWNKAIERMTGIKAENMVGKGNYEYAMPFYGERRPQLMDIVWEGGPSLEDKYPYINRDRDGESITSEAFCNALYDGRGAQVFAKVSPLYNTAGQIVGSIESIRDITESKRMEIYRTLSVKILEILNQSDEFPLSLRQILEAVKRETGCDAAGIRLRENGDFPYYVQIGFPDDFVVTDNLLAPCYPEGKICGKPGGTDELECICGLIVCGKADLSNPLFTPGGSFWINDSSLLTGLPESELPWHSPRNECIRQGYASIALIPIREGKQVVGLLQLNDFRKGQFSLEAVNMLEGISSHIGEALLRKRMEEERKETEMKFTNLFQSAPVLISLTDVETGRYIDVNDEALRVSGFNRDEVIGQTAAEIGWITQEERQRLLDKFKSIQSDESFEMDFRTKDGRKITGLVKGGIIPIAGHDCMLTATIDITDRKVIEKELQETKERYDYATIVGKVGTWDWDILLDQMVWSDETYRLMGFMPGAITPSYEWYLERVHPDDRALLDASLKATWRDKKAYSLDCRFVLEDETELVCHITGKVEFDAEGRPIRMLGTIQDITERKREEQEHRDLQDRLSRSEKMEALGLMAGGVAHDLNNALGLLVGYAEFLHDDFDDSDPRKEDARNILMGGEQAAAVVQDLLTLARRGVQTKTTVNLNKIVREYLKSPEYMKLTTLHPGIRIRTELEGGLLLIRGSSVHLSKTLTNLVINAAEAMPSGGDLLIRTENRYLDRPVSGYDELRDGDYVVLTVRDEGEGISAGDMQHIFEPFYTKKVMGRSGTGLGLSVVWGTVKDHSGYIDVESRMGEGSTFQLYFPVTEEGESEKDAAISVDHYTGHGERILVIDDVLEQRNLARRILTGLQYEVETAGSGEEGVSCLRERPFDLIVLDMIMDPGIDGFETYRRILEVRPGQRAIIVSGFAETERVKMAQALGAGPFVRKPYIKERIGMAVKKELGSKI